MTRASRLGAVVLVLLMLPLPGMSSHIDGDYPEKPDAGEGPLIGTGIEPVDEAQEDARTAGNAGLSALYDAVGPTARPVHAGAPRSTVTLFEEHVAGDGQHGIIGEWTAFGGWSADGSYARKGDWGFGIGDAERYPTDTTAALLTPELDLRTGFGPRAASGSIPDNSLPLNPRDVVSNVGAYQQAAATTDDPLFILDFWLRHNLANGIDDVELWLIEHRGPRTLTAADFGSCARLQGCTRLPHAYTGTSEWSRHTVDLTDWAEERVQVAFVFNAERNFLGDAFFANEGLFATDDFYGVQVDDLELRAPAAPSNLQVHELLSPLENQELDIGTPVTVRTLVRNTGSVPMTARTTVELDFPGAPSDFRKVLDDVVLAPGASQPVNVAFPPVGAIHTVTASVSVEAVEAEGMQSVALPELGPVNGFVQGIVDSAPLVGPVLDDAGPLVEDAETLVEESSPVGNPKDTADAALEEVPTGEQETPVPVLHSTVDVNERDDADAVSFTTNRVRELTMEAPQASRTWVDLNQPFSVDITVHNTGTVALDDVTLLPYLADADAEVGSDDHDASDRIVGNLERTFGLAVGESRTVTWDLDTTETGRFRFHVRTSQLPEFSPLDFQTGRTTDILTVHRASDPAVDAQEEFLWNGVPSHPIVFQGDGPSVTAQVKVISTANGLNLLVRLPDTSNDLTDPLHDDELYLYFDDLGDEELLDGEDAVRLGPGGDTFTDLRYDASTGTWVEDESPAGDGAREHAGSQYTIELHRPYEDSLATGPGQFLGLAGLVRNVQRNAEDETVTLRYHPSEAAVTGPDGLGSWTLVEVVYDPSQRPLGEKVASRGFGIGTGPPPVAEYDFTKQCPDFGSNAWAHSGDSVTNFDGDAVGVDGWGCGYYDPAGTNLLYAGLHRYENVLCGSGPCRPYSSGEFKGGLNPHDHISTLSFRPGAIEADDPYLLLRHQYATPVRADDDAQLDDPEWDLQIDSVASVRAIIDGVTYALTPGIEGITSTRAWDTEAGNDLRDPRYGPGGRDISTAGYCSSSATTPGPVHCGWWYPAGFVSNYLPKDEEYAVGETFQGSPWKVDRIPLTGQHWTRVDAHGMPVTAPFELPLAGSDVEFQFLFDRFYDGHRTIDYDLTPQRPHGWRIAALAITEGPGGVRDLSLDDAQLDLSYDPAEIGLGAGTGTEVRVRMEVTNVGATTVEGAVLQAVCLDADNPDAQPIHVGATSLTEPLEPAQTVTGSAACILPEAALGGRVRVEARVVLPGGDDLDINNVLPIDGVYDVRKSPDVAVHATATPSRGSPEQPRFVEVVLENRGNVPLSDFEVGLRFSRGQATLLERDPWTIYPAGDGRDLGVGERLRITNRAAPFLGIPLSDLRFDQLGESGAYTVRANAMLADDVRPEDNIGASPFEVVTNLYTDGFAGPPTFELPGLVGGSMQTTGDVWEVTSTDGRNVALAGDGETLPALSDGSLVLPSLDLTSANGATISLRHAYDLETGYDAARVEVSVDDGQTWEPLAPMPSLSNPLGYPDEVLVGSNALLEGAPEARAAGFTGSSTDDPSSDEHGFVVTEFRLGAAKSLQKVEQLAEFPLEELATHPTNKFTDAGDGNEYLMDGSWSPPGTTDGWLIDNQRTNQPKPLAGEKMLWSGTPGEWTKDQHNHVETDLTLDLDLRQLGADQGAALRFWDYRSGWQDAELYEPRGEDRDGTGGWFRIEIEDDGDVKEVFPRVLERRADGWTLREVDLIGYVGKEIDVRFAYEALPDPGLHPSELVGRPDLFYSIQVQESGGWFLDELYAESFTLHRGERIDRQPLTAVDGFESYALEVTGNPCDDFGPYQRSQTPREDQGVSKPSAGCWQVRDQADPRPAAWHLDEVPGPTGRAVKAWRIASDDVQGYDHLLDTRLVTPSVDLRSVVGQQATLEFDHRYHLGLDPSTPGLSPLDGGVVEVQVYDERTGTYGPWKQVLAGDPGRPVVDMTSFQAQSRRHPTAFVIDTREQSGYSTVFPRGNYNPNGGAGEDTGLGVPFDPFPGICRGCIGAKTVNDFAPHPVAYAYSGDSGGWEHVSFDVSQFIGEKVRFAFHAWSNPSDRLTEEQRQGAGPLLGWDVTNVAVEGVVFDGKPVQLRFRVATDDSIRDGHWTIDSLEVSGNILRRNLALEGVEGELRFPTGEDPSWTVDLTNIGRQPRNGIALGVRAVQDGEVIAVEASDGQSDAIPDDEVPNRLDGEVVLGPLDLTSVGNQGSSRTWTISLPDVAPGSPVQVQARILEDNGDTVIVDGELVHTPRFTTPEEPFLANTRTSWTVMVEDVVELGFEPQDNGLDVRVDGAGPGASGATVSVAGTLVNEGTVATVQDITWTLEDLVGGQVLAARLEEDVRVDAGEDLDLLWDLPDLSTRGDGLYRVTVATDGATAVIEFPVGRSESIFVEDFAGDLPVGWTVADTIDREQQPGADNVAWSADRVDGFLSWGVHPFAPGENDYCGGPSRLVCGDPNGGPGFDGTATYGPVRLDTALNGRAELVLEHSFSFFSDEQQGGDGGRMEVAVLDADGDIVECDAPGGRTWMPLTPTSGTVHDDTTRDGTLNGVPRGNPFGDGAPVFAGPRGSILQPTRTTYDLSGVTWCPGGSVATPLEDATAALRFSVGIWDGPHTSDRFGWQVDAVGVSSGGVSLGPLDGDQRTIAMDRNAPKRIAYTVHNNGVARDEFRLQVSSADPLAEWASLEEETIELDGGETRLVWVRIQTPETLPAGQHALRLTAESLHDAATRDALETILHVAPLDKPDLVAFVAVEPEGYQQGSVATVPVHITNGGDVASRPTSVRLESIRMDEPGAEPVHIETLPVPTVCAPAACGPVRSRTVVTAEWAVPETTGTYLVRAIIDPEGQLLDRDAVNNVNAQLVEVVPLQRPDLAVVDIQVEDADGPITGRFVDDGSIITVRAVVRNDGPAPSQGATARLRAGTVVLSEEKLPLLPFGASHEVEAVQIIQDDGTGVLELTALVTGGLQAELRDDNNKLLRSLVVRTHDVRLEAREDLAARAGSASTVPVRVHNDGNALETLQLEATGPEGWKVQVMTPKVVVPPGGSTVGLLLAQVPEDVQAGRRTIEVLAKVGDRVVARVEAPIEVAAVLGSANATFDLGDVRSGDAVLPLELVSNANVDQALRVSDALGWIEPLELTLHAFQNQSVELPLRIPADTAPGTYPDRLIVAAVDGTWERVVQHDWTVLPTAAVEASWLDVVPLPVTGNGTRGLELRLGLTSLSNVPVTLEVRPETAEGTNVALPAPLFLEPLEKRVLPLRVYVDERLATPQGKVHLDLGGAAEASLPLDLPDLTSGPDLTVAALVLDVKDGVPSVRGVVRNDGDGPAVASTVHAYLEGVLVATAPIPAMTPAQEVGFNMTWPSVPGGGLLVVMADGGRVVLELHEDNNGATTTVPDLEPVLTSSVFRGIPSVPVVLLLAALVALAIRRRSA